jgi:catechol 2,3-dioxygenase-like lactoylglutathione lyase family enzyme
MAITKEKNPPDSYVVGGVQLQRPFRARRFGHFGYTVDDVELAKNFYIDVLGFKLSDTFDITEFAPEHLKARGRVLGHFLRYSSDHHQFIVLPTGTTDGALPTKNPEVTTFQISWQAGTLREVVQGRAWMEAQGREILMAGRDVPGSNFHFYTRDYEGHINELFYGIEQIGWNGRSKPQTLIALLGLHTPAKLPHVSEWTELKRLREQGIDLEAGTAPADADTEPCDVGGVLLARPFRVTGMGPVRLFIRDMEKALDFYRNLWGLTVTEEVVWRGHRCVLLRANTEHHSLALYPMELREVLGVNQKSTVMSLGLKVLDYAQLRDARAYLKDRGVEVRALPQELFPGLGPNFFFVDPCGNWVQMYHRIEQIGWDGKPRPASERVRFDANEWPATVPASEDEFIGEVFMGPLG